MRIMHVALGGCLSAPPVSYGVTEDTGGHIAYVLGAAVAQAHLPAVQRVDIVTRAFDDARLGAQYAVPEEIVTDGVMIRRLSTARRAYLEKEALESELPALTDAFLEMLESGPRPDLLHAHFSDAAELCAAAAERFGIPWLFTPHSLGADKRGAEVDAELERRIAREARALARADAVIVSSRDEAERQVSNLVPDAAGRTFRLNPGRTQPATRDLGPAHRLIAPHLDAPEKPVILAIARPVEKKNLAGLIDAYAGCATLRKTANLVIVAGIRGDGTTPGDAVFRDLQDRVAAAGLAGRVALPPDHAPEDIPSLYALAAARSGVFVNPALHEPFGLTVVEAAQAGVPVVATNRGGPPDILRARSAMAGWSARPIMPHSRPRCAPLSTTRPSPRPRPSPPDAAPKAPSAGTAGGGAQPRNRAPGGPGSAGARDPGWLLASDIDDTLTGSRQAARRFADWRSARSNDVLFAVATGRTVSEARGVLHEWDLPEPDVFVTSVGTEIWRHDRCGALRLDDAYATRISRGWNREAAIAICAAQGLTAQADYEQRQWKLSYVGSPDAARRAAAALDEAGAGARVIHSHGRLIDVIPERAGKWAAACHVAGQAGLGFDRIVCAGDSGNDRDMLEAAPARSCLPTPGASCRAAAAHRAGAGGRPMPTACWRGSSG
ncbi:HAD-IIB family hydrolase [Roseivivax marinus]|uniref:HAD-IIB family hydrolase n=1 Tax=Roseivivax marinus TaxID=1379903 RepID=UPI001F044273|nr:HAD-IIB family hydrolase [Roseivivax marinus]UMA63473.1 HAD-IIB family hydrolase [Roseivivax marinus]